MTATLERPRTTDARITGGSSEVVHTTVTMDPSPIAHLTPEQIEELGRELDEIRASVMDSLGEKDAQYIRRMIKAQRYLEIGGRAALFFSGNPSPGSPARPRSARRRSSTTWRSGTTSSTASGTGCVTRRSTPRRGSGTTSPRRTTGRTATTRSTTPTPTSSATTTTWALPLSFSE